MCPPTKKTAPKRPPPKLGAELGQGKVETVVLRSTRGRTRRRLNFLEDNCRWMKYAVIAYSIGLGLLGVIIVSVGVWLITGANQVLPLTSIPFLGDIIKLAAGILIGFGVCIILMSLLGGFGAFKENQCMMTTFSVLLGSALFLELGCGVWAFRMYGDEYGSVTGGGASSITITVIGFILSTIYCCYVTKSADRVQGYPV
ncbi:tetraspanin-4-like [Lineus longissimus]|uniref:tetraspanin-4-like n=1 Tax=Lineus longissimus TaxID=88925 RepID=UPI002B4F888B